MRKNKWRGVKWIDTRFARKYHTERALTRAMAAGILAAGQARINIINSAHGLPEIKAMQTSNAVLETVKAAADCIKKRNDELDRRWRAFR